ncbi:MAG TPA: response regulator [Planctomycetota bacterium]|jgi:DNA-binding response OmpR family regulator|nr:response regulator [Planctomycetota bacterium]
MDERRPLLIFADRDLSWSLPLRKRLGERGFTIETSTSARDLLERVTRSRPDLVVLGDGVDDLGGRFLGALVQERSPDSRIIRALPPDHSKSAEEPGPAENVLCSVMKRASAEDLDRVITRVLGCAPRAKLPTRPPLVVCVDDDALFLQSLARIIRRQGYRVLSYTEPELALEELPLVKPDLVILDVLMPGWSGFEVLGEIRQFYTAKVPVVLLSALGGESRLAQGRRHGAACYLTKPCAPEILVDTLRRVLAVPDLATNDPAVGSK